MRPTSRAALGLVALTGLAVTVLASAALAAGAVRRSGATTFGASDSAFVFHTAVVPNTDVAPTPTAHPVVGIAAVGPLFAPSVFGAAPALGLPHYCSASVVHSASRDLVLTAAHCVAGPGLGIDFAPGFHDGVSPDGVWSVTAAYVDADDDVAILRVAPHGATRVEDVTGANTLATAPAAGTAVTVDGYVAGAGGTAITCTAAVTDTGGTPTFPCAGYADGVSGGPWLVGATVVGLTGGLYGGGCTPDVSYSPVFGPPVSALLARADAGGPGDLAPLAPADGC